MKYDLHVHSTYSDGLYTIEDLLKMAKSKGIDKIAITDHDDISCVNYDDIIYGIELSTRLNGEDIHLLGYFKTLDKIDELRDYLANQKKNRIERIINMCKLLDIHYNIKIDSSEILKNSLGTIGRPHIAEAISNKLNITKEEAFKRYLSSDSKAFISSSKITLEEGARLLHKANAIVILAHPIQYKKNDINELIKYVDGIEAIYPDNRLEDTLKFINIAFKNNLLITAGSDFHGDKKHKDLGYCTLEDNYLKDFLYKLMER